MPKAGDKVLIDVGQANDGRWYWRESRSSMDLHGPFLTEVRRTRTPSVRSSDPTMTINLKSSQ